MPERFELGCMNDDYCSDLGSAFAPLLSALLAIGLREKYRNSKSQLHNKPLDSTGLERTLPAICFCSCSLAPCLLIAP